MAKLSAASSLEEYIIIIIIIIIIIGGRDSLLVRAPDSSSKGCEFESRQERRKNFLLQS